MKKYKYVFDIVVGDEALSGVYNSSLLIMKYTLAISIAGRHYDDIATTFNTYSESLALMRKVEKSLAAHIKEPIQCALYRGKKLLYVETV